MVSIDDGAEARPLIPFVPLVSDLHTPLLIRVYSTLFIGAVSGRAAMQNFISKHTQEAHISDILMDQIFTKECMKNMETEKHGRVWFNQATVLCLILLIPILQM